MPAQHDFFAARFSIGPSKLTMRKFSPLLSAPIGFFSMIASLARSPLHLWLLILVASCFFPGGPSAYSQTKTRETENYPIHPDSHLKEGVPQGEVLEGEFHDSEFFPGTHRKYWVYIPKQYRATQPAALMVFQDGRNYARRDGGFYVLNVFDNLIHSSEMPVTIGLFIEPGVVPAPTPDAQDRFNRSLEYDSMDDRYASFLLQEMIPHVVERHRLNLSDDPNDRAICGSSSGGIAAFNVAWQRPDVFRRVFTTVGTYVGLRGAHEFSTIIRKTEPKPLRVFLQDGSNDLNIYGGDWWMANQAMLRSLEFAGYEVQHAWGDGFHSGKHGASIFPDVMRWLWEGHGQVPVATHWDRCQNDAPKLLVADETWELVSDGHQWAEGMAYTDDGNLWITDVPASKLYRIGPDGTRQVVVEDTGRANGVALGPDGRLYTASSGAEQIRAYDLKTLAMEVIAEGTKSNDIVVRQDGTIYYTDPAASKVWMIEPKNRQRKLATPFKDCNGIAVSPDQAQLLIAHFPGRFVHTAFIDSDRSLIFQQPFFHLEVPVNQLQGHLDGMCCTQEGWLVSATEAGVQICDPAGRSHLILPMPPGSKRPCYARFGGEDGRTLYVANVDKVLKRKTQMVGSKPWEKPIKPPKPKL
jgi:sugar lactone lactonase YvrE/enterochelin esterase-like enzyme